MDTPCPEQIRAWTYILASQTRGTLYTGSTTDLARRLWEHKDGVSSGFTKTYKVKRLVWFEPHEGVVAAATRERAIKRWKRAWKIALIEADNPTWRDLGAEFVGD